MWIQILDRMLRRLIRRGVLTVTYPDGQTRTYQGTDGPIAALALTDPTLPRRIVLNPELAFGEGYMAGTLTVENDDLHGFIKLFMRNWELGNRGPLMTLDEMRRSLIRRTTQANPLGLAQSHVAHHYDISQDLYDLFLDADKQYSCAYFQNPDDSLETAQTRKKALIAAKLCLAPGQRVLDIGCGWGGMAITLARDYGVQVTGVTLSSDQHRIATSRVLAAGLQDRVDIRLTDYREVTGQFDRIVSVGMFEHVGPPHYPEYFSHVRSLLAPGGVALIHTIGRLATPVTVSPWILKYIFPGGHIPTLTEIMPDIEKSGLMTADIEIWRLHYARTLRHWQNRFEAHKDTVLQMFDDRFYRMWRLYLIASEVSFTDGRQVVFQIQLTDRLDAVIPTTRDYLYGDERMALAAQ